MYVLCSLPSLYLTFAYIQHPHVHVYDEVWRLNPIVVIFPSGRGCMVGSCDVIFQYQLEFVLSELYPGVH